MMKIQKTPKKVYLAFSGGADSMFALHFLLQGRKDVTCLYFNHKTNFGKESLAFVTEVCKQAGVKLITESLAVSPPKGCSKENYWRNARYQFFDKYDDAPIITAHHLDDQIETMLMGFCKGKEQWIRPELQRQPGCLLIRPFLEVSRKEILDYLSKYDIMYLNDPSNEDVSHPRNRIRHNVVPELLKAYPGFYKTLKRQKCQLKSDTKV